MVLKMADAGSSGLLWDWAASEVVRGAGACAVVCTPLGDTYVVIRLDKAGSVVSLAARMKASVEQLPGNPKVTWVCPLNRRHQRLLCWGDVGATDEDLAQAVAAQDVEAMAALLPRCADMLRHGQLEWRHMPALLSVSRGAPVASLAIEDRGAFEGDADAEDTIPQRVAHDALDKHTWSERTNRKAQCDWCSAWDPHECDCGARRCARCMAPEAEGSKPTCIWRQHPTRPLPFSVQDHLRWADHEKLAWIRQEIGEKADLEDFARKWMDLFAGKLHGVVPQKAACIKLYAEYRPPTVGRPWRCESDLPPDVLAPFERIWNPEAPDRCYECGKPVGAQHVRRLGMPFCSQRCATVDAVVVCKQCGTRVNPEWTGCSSCKWGLWEHSAPPPPLKWPEEQIADMTEEQLLRRVRAMNFWWWWDRDVKRCCLWMMILYCKISKQSDHVPAWKRRRRS